MGKKNQWNTMLIQHGIPFRINNDRRVPLTRPSTGVASGQLERGIPSGYQYRVQPSERGTFRTLYGFRERVDGYVNAGTPESRR